jgi:hypothetical protein
MISCGPVVAELRFADDRWTKDSLQLHREIRRANVIGGRAGVAGVHEIGIVEVVACEQRGLVREAVVEPEQHGIFIVRHALRADPVVDVRIARAGGALRVYRDDAGQRRGHDGAKCRARHRTGEAALLPLTDPFVVGEKERALRDNRPADVAAELIEGERRHVANGRERPRIEAIVPYEIERRPAVSVGARLGDQLHDPAGSRARLGRVQCRADAELGDRLAADDQARITVLPRILDAGRVDAVERPVVVITRPADESRAQVGAFAGVDRTWRQQHQPRPMAAGERQILQLARLNDGADRRGRSIQERRRSLHLNDFGDLPDLHLHVEDAALADFQLDVALADGLEPGQLRGDLVVPCGKKVEHVDAGAVRHGFTVQACRRRFQLDDDTGQHRAARIGDCAMEGRVARLCRAFGDIGAEQCHKEE